MVLMQYSLMVLQIINCKISKYCLQWITPILDIEEWLELHLNRVIGNCPNL